MRIAMFGNQTGSWNWRLDDPAKYLRRLGHDVHCIQNEAITEKVVAWADIVVLNSVVDKDGIALCYQYQQENGLKIVVDTDDDLLVNADSPFLEEHKTAQAPEVRQITTEIANLVTVTTKYLARQLSKYNKNVVVLPNSLDMEQWDIEPKAKNTSEQFRIGWAGSVTHLEDLKMIVKPLRRIMDEYPQVKLIFIGELRMMDYFQGYNVECMLGVEHKAWPMRLHGLALDLALAPLRDSSFNRCKSNIKYQEYSINKIPGIYSPTVYSYSGGFALDPFDGNFGHIAYNEEQWYRCIKNMIISSELREAMGNKAYSMVKRKYDLSKNIKLWEKAYQSILTQKNN